MGDFRAFLRAYFGSEVRVGQAWRFDDRDPLEKPWSVEVVAVKGGYVQYKHCPRLLGHLRTVTIPQFRFAFVLDKGWKYGKRCE